MTLPDRDRLCSFLETPLQLFAELYLFVEPRYRTISNQIYTDPQARKRFDKLSKFFSFKLKRIYSTPSQKGFPNSIIKKIQQESSDNLLCLSLLTGLAEYLAGRKGILHGVEQLKIGDLFISLTPPNPIYAALPNPIRENMGTGMEDIEVLKKISVIQQGEMKTSLVMNSVLVKTNECFGLLKGKFRIAVSPFMKSLDFQFASLLDDWPADKKTPFWLQGITNQKKVEDFLVSKILEPCLEQGVTVLVLPELVIDDTMLAVLRQWLRAYNRQMVSSGRRGILLLVAGSFHIAEADGNLYNISTVLNYEGEILWRQKKMQRYSFDAKDLQSSPYLKDLLKTSDAGGHEKIVLDDTILCADTPIGRVCVSICIDYIDMGNTEAYRKTGVNIFLVPAMTSSNARYTDAARNRGSSNLASSFFANSRYIDNGQKGVSFFYLPDSQLTFRYAGNDQEFLVFDMDDIGS